MCFYDNKQSRTYQICPCHLGVRQTLWADQNMVLLFINTHLWHKEKPFMIDFPGKKSYLDSRQPI